MEFKTHHIKDLQIAEIIADGIIINDADTALDLLGNLYYQGFDKIIIHEHNLSPNFFDLKTGLAGEILQKFSNYRVQLAIVGDFAKYTRKSINEFMHESNQGRQVAFVDSVEAAVAKFSR